MKLKKDSKFIKIYGIIGKSLCGCSGAAIGFILGGPFMSFLGMFMGIIVGHLLEKGVLEASF